jgi:hypothetical protein
MYGRDQLIMKKPQRFGALVMEKNRRKTSGVYVFLFASFYLLAE